MRKKIFMVVAATMVCATLVVGCGNNKKESGKEATKETATEITETAPSETDSVEETEEVDASLGEEIAAKYGVKLESNQGIITSEDGEAIVVTLLDGYKFLTQHVENYITMEKIDYSESYKVFDCTDMLTEEVMNENAEVEDYGNGLFVQSDKTSAIIKAFWFDGDTKVVVMYTNDTDNSTDFDTVLANIKSIIENLKACK